MASQEPWWKAVEAALRQQYGASCIIERPRPIEVQLGSGRSIRIDRTWYDVLVLEQQVADRVLTQSTPGVHCVEVKWSGKGKRGSFGAFIIGEWIAAKLSLGGAAFSYEILYAWGDPEGTGVQVDKLALTGSLLEDMLLYPNVKLYFYPSLIHQHVAGAAERRGLVRARKLNPAVSMVTEALEQTLDELLKPPADSNNGIRVM